MVGSRMLNAQTVRGSISVQVFKIKELIYYARLFLIIIVNTAFYYM